MKLDNNIPMNFVEWRSVEVFLLVGPSRPTEEKSNEIDGNECRFGEKNITHHENASI